jgi:hypothetical protein
MPVVLPALSVCFIGGCFAPDNGSAGTVHSDLKRSPGVHNLSVLTIDLLCRLFTLVPTKKQVKDLLDHVDSPYIRAVWGYHQCF